MASPWRRSARHLRCPAGRGCSASTGRIEEDPRIAVLSGQPMQNIYEPPGIPFGVTSCCTSPRGSSGCRTITLCPGLLGSDFGY
eukprot:7518927-Alexandrium_andersonii.AAC.1